MKHLTIRTKLLVSFLILSAVTMGVGGVGLFGIYRTREIGRELDRFGAIRQNLLQREIDHLNWVRKVGEFQRDEKLQTIDVEKNPHNCGFGRWYYGPQRIEAEAAVPGLAEILRQIEDPHVRLHESAVKLENSLKKGPEGRLEALQFYKTETNAVLKEIQALFGKMQPHLAAATEHHQVEAKVENSRANWFTMIGAGAGVVIAISLGLFVSSSINKFIRRVTGDLSAASVQLNEASCQVASASQALAEGSSEQASSLEETSASLEEMAGMTKRNAENAAKANELARQTRVAADTGATDMQSMNLAMRGIKDSSDDVAKIIKTIDEIPFQTNILALNAAVEAARAGEAGAGFAVVADEVRALAQRSAQAAKETAEKIEGAIGRTSQGVQISEKVTRSLAEIVEKVRQVDTLVAEVTTASREQSDGVHQINGAVSQMDRVVQSNAGAAEESAAAAEELSAQAATLNEAVVKLARLVGGAGVSNAPQSNGAFAGQVENPAAKAPAKPLSARPVARELAFAGHDFRKI